VSRDASSESGDAPQIAQAQAIVSAQARCSLDAALALMQDTASATDETLEHIAVMVVNGTLSFG
jgi:AmiR/NasT family two-component response regulator